MLAFRMDNIPPQRTDRFFFILIAATSYLVLVGPADGASEASATAQLLTPRPVLVLALACFTEGARTLLCPTTP